MIYSLFHDLLPVIGLCLGANLDLLFAATSRYELLQNGKSFCNLLCISGASTLMTTISTICGMWIAPVFPPTAAKQISGAVLILLSLFALGKSFQKQKKPSCQSVKIILLSFLLSLNNIGPGIAAGVAGLSPVLMFACTLCFTLTACYLGIHLSKKLLSCLTESSLERISNCILLFIGLCQLGLFHFLFDLISWTVQFFTH